MMSGMNPMAYDIYVHHHHQGRIHGHLTCFTLGGLSGLVYG